MKPFLHNKALYKGVSVGLLISALFVFIFSAIFSYSQETNLFATLLFTVSLFVLYLSENQKQPDNARASSAGTKLLNAIFLVLSPLILSIILIQGDLRSWILVAISTILTWVVIK